MAENPSVLGPTREGNRGGTEQRTFSLMEVAQETGIAMPILLRYKREFPDRIPSEGSGSQQRFPEEAFAIFTELHHKESEQRDLPRRGGFGLLSLPRMRRKREAPATEPAAGDAAESGHRAASAAPEAPAPPAAASSSTVEPAEPATAPDAAAAPAPTSAKPRTGAATLTLKAISDELGIAYPTIARYATKHEHRIPHVGEGRKRRFPPEAIEVFRQIRKESKPGRPPKAKTQKKRAEARARAQTRVETGTGTGSGVAAPAATGTAAVAAAARPPEALVRRIEQLERHQQQLETMVRSLREELERPVTAIIEPA